ncbi:hypothetical protein ACFQZE_23985 [Paenibacillus sp. GCM10027627]|uniref:hypothetical protein n=1 Tax=unclassified Paenibacillus TaxID=185978 RepID=UPI00362A12C9
MNSNEKGFTIGLYTTNPVVDEYIKHEMQGTNILSLQDHDPWEGCQAILLYDIDLDRIQHLYDLAIKAVDTTVDVIWYVENENDKEKAQMEKELQSRGVHVHVDRVEDAAQILGMIALYEEVKRQETLGEVKVDSTTAEKKETSSLRDSLFFKRAGGESSDLIDDEYELDVESKKKIAGIFQRTKQSLQIKRSEAHASLPDELENVVAVAGFHGAGSSFIAWNLARILDGSRVLVEGRKTGTLAAWFSLGEQAVTRGQFLETHQGDRYSHDLDELELALQADKETGRRELKAMREVPKRLVVDCGHRWDLEVYKRAAVRIFIAAPDPQFIGIRPEVDAHVVVLNQYPEGSSIPVSEFEKRFNMKFQLVVPSQPRQVMNSIWGKRAWVLMENENRESWNELKRMVEREVRL